MYKIVDNSKDVLAIKKFSDQIVKKAKGILFSDYDIMTKTNFITENADDIYLIDSETNTLELDYNFLLLDFEDVDTLSLRINLQKILKSVLGDEISITSYPGVLKTSIIEINNTKFVINFEILVFDELYNSLVVNGKIKQHAFWFSIPNSSGYLEQIETIKQYVEDYAEIKDIYLKARNEYKEDLECPYQAAFCYIYAVNFIARNLVSQGKIKAY